MASKLIVPFNFQPFSVSVKTGAYTIPAGYYAYVSAFCDASETFSIGGVVALRGNSAIAASGSGYDTGNVNLSSGNTNTALSYTVPTGYQFQIHAAECNSSGLSNSTLTLHSGEVVVANITSSVYKAWETGLSNVRLAEGVVVACNHVNTSYNLTKELWGMVERKNSINAGQTGTTSTNNFWVSSGTALTTSGGEYTVTLFPNIS